MLALRVTVVSANLTSSAILMRELKTPLQLIGLRVREPVVGNLDISFAGIDSDDHGRSDVLLVAGHLDTWIVSM